MNTNLATWGKNYIAIINEIPVGFISIVKFAHPKTKNMYRVHRLVVLPDYQGIGIGGKLLDFIAERYKKSGYRFNITTSTPAIISIFKNNPFWKCKRIGRNPKISKSGFKNNSVSFKRLTTSWEYK